MAHIHCERGDHDWDRPPQPGRPPKSCPEHQPPPPLPRLHPKHKKDLEARKKGRRQFNIAEKQRLSPEALKARERARQAVEMRIAGVNNQVIAETLGYAHRSSVSKAIKSYLRESAHEVGSELRMLEVERLDKALFAIWKDVQGGRYRAIEIMLKIQERKAALLGIDAPQRRVLEVVTPEVLREALAQRKTELKELEEKSSPPAIDVDFEELEAIVEGEQVQEAEVISVRTEAQPSLSATQAD